MGLPKKQASHTNKVPSCRFWFFHIVIVAGKKRRRRGKPLVDKPYIENSNDRNQQFRVQVRREQPFRSTSNDVCQATDRCNVDFQFLSCAPPIDGDAAQLPGTADQQSELQHSAHAADSGASQPHPITHQHRRLRKKTNPLRRGIRKDSETKRSDRPEWVPICKFL